MRRARRRGASTRAPRAGRPAARARAAASAVAAIARWPGRRQSTPQVRPSRAATARRRIRRSSCVAEPRERGAAFGRAQRLFVGPQLLGGVAAADDERAARDRRPPRSAPARTAGAAARSTRRRGPRLSRASAGSVRRSLADALAREHDLGQRAARPAAAGQHGVERGKPDGSAAGSGAQSPPRQIAGWERTAASAGFMRAAVVSRGSGKPRISSVSGRGVSPSLRSHRFRRRRSISSGETSSTWVARSRNDRTDRRRRRCGRRRDWSRTGRTAVAAGGDRLRELRVDVGDVDHEAGRGAADRGWAALRLRSAFRRRASSANRRF